MRILICTHPAIGHFNPLAALADAAQGAGCEVLFACPPGFRQHVRSVGFDAVAMGDDWATRDLGETFPEFRAVALDDRNRWINERLWAELLPQSYFDGLCAAVEHYRPDVIVSGRAELAGPTAGELLGVPYAVTSAGRVIALREFLDQIAPARERWRAGLGLPPDPDGRHLYRHLYISALPPAFFPDALPDHHIVVSPESFSRPAGDDITDWLSDHESGPTAYVTLGSAYGYQFPHLFDHVTSGLEGVVPRALVTTGAAAGYQVRASHDCLYVLSVDYVAQDSVFPYVDLVICHGGSGTIFGALAAGVPVLVLADEQSDHRLNGRRCAELGVGAMLEAHDLTPRDLAAAATDLLADPSYRRAATRMAAGIATLAPLDQAVVALESLVSGRHGGS